MHVKTNRLLLFILTLVTIISSESFSFIPNFRILRVLIWIMFAIYLLFFYENQHYQDKRLQKQLLYCIGVIYLIYYILYFMIGIRIGFSHNPYNVTVSGMLENIILTIPIFLIQEYVRYYLFSTTKEEQKGILALTLAFVFTFANFNILTDVRYFQSLSGVGYLFLFLLIPYFVKDLMLSFLSNYGGYLSSVSYLLIPYLVLYTMPILPTLDPKLVTIFELLALFLLFLITSSLVWKEKTKSYHIPSLKTGIVYFVVIIVFLFLGVKVVPENTLVIASNSMYPSIHRGDIVLIQKKPFSSVQKNDIIKYRLDNQYIVHRVVEIKTNGKQEKYFVTKGDNNNEVDLYPVMEDQYEGVVVGKIPYLGYPRLILNDILYG